MLLPLPAVTRAAAVRGEGLPVDTFPCARCLRGTRHCDRCVAPFCCSAAPAATANRAVHQIVEVMRPEDKEARLKSLLVRH
jgi:hypothetical protein